MKKFTLFIMTIFAMGTTLAQTVDDFSAVIPITDNNMSVVFPAGTLSDFVGGNLQAYVNGVPVSNALPSYNGVIPSLVGVEGSGGVAIIGTDGPCGCDLASGGDEISFAILLNGETIILINVNPPLTYIANGFEMISGSIDLSIDGNPVEFGCMNSAYVEYSATANIENTSCATLKVFGCIDATACNVTTTANTADGSCIYVDGYCDTCENGIFVDNDADNDTVCDDDEISGCQETWADNYMPEATDDDSSCYKYGCTDIEANNYDIGVTNDDGSCVYFTPIEYQLTNGWNMVGYTGTADNNGIVAQMDAALGNGESTANTFQVIKNVSGQFWSAGYAQITTFNQGQGYMMYVIGDATTVNFQQTSGYNSGIVYDLTIGWNMVAFTGDVDAEDNIVSSMDAALVNGAGTANTFQVIKNVSGQFWSADYAQITTFIPGQAYMMYVNGSPTTVNFQQE